MASTTKIMTALVAAENGDLSQKIRIPTAFASYFAEVRRGGFSVQRLIARPTARSSTSAFFA
jgi:D-alanyl-D-alanine carboxypeptidase